MASWGEHLINFVLDLSAALVAAWLIWQYSSKLSDYWAHRSRVSVRKKVTRLETLLAKYESDFSDSRTFIARIVMRASFSIVIILSLIILITGLVVGNAVYVYTVECTLQNTCAGENFYFWIAAVGNSTSSDCFALFFYDVPLR